MAVPRGQAFVHDLVQLGDLAASALHLDPEHVVGQSALIRRIRIADVEQNSVTIPIEHLLVAEGCLPQRTPQALETVIPRLLRTQLVEDQEVLALQPQDIPEPADAVVVVEQALHEARGRQICLDELLREQREQGAPPVAYDRDGIVVDRAPVGVVRVQQADHALVGHADDRVGIFVVMVAPAQSVEEQVLVMRFEAAAQRDLVERASARDAGQGARDAREPAQVVIRALGDGDAANPRDGRRRDALMLDDVPAHALPMLVRQPCQGRRIRRERDGPQELSLQIRARPAGIAKLSFVPQVVGHCHTQLCERGRLAGLKVAAFVRCQRPVDQVLGHVTEVPARILLRLRRMGLTSEQHVGHPHPGLRRTVGVVVGEVPAGDPTGQQRERHVVV